SPREPVPAWHRCDARYVRRVAERPRPAWSHPAEQEWCETYEMLLSGTDWLPEHASMSPCSSFGKYSQGNSHPDHGTHRFPHISVTGSMREKQRVFLLSAENVCSPAQIIRHSRCSFLMFSSALIRPCSCLHWLLHVFYQDNQASHLIAGLPRIHQVRENVAMERVDTAGRGPGVEREIVGRAGFHREGIALDGLGQEMPILRHDVESVTMQMHSLPMFDADGLGIGKAFSVDHVVAAQHAN